MYCLQMHNLFLYMEGRVFTYGEPHPLIFNHILNYNDINKKEEEIMA